MGKINLEGVLYKFSLKSPKLNIESTGINYEQSHILFNSALKFFKEDYPNNKELITNLNCFEALMGLGSYSHGNSLMISCEAYIESIPENTPFDCPERLNYSKVGNTKSDDWLRVGKYRVCSYCKSIHPHDLVEAINEFGSSIINNPKGGYKIYLRIPGVENASLGPIKYYRWHDNYEIVEILRNI